MERGIGAGRGVATGTHAWQRARDGRGGGADEHGEGRKEALAGRSEGKERRESREGGGARDGGGRGRSGRGEGGGGHGGRRPTEDLELGVGGRMKRLGSTGSWPAGGGAGQGSDKLGLEGAREATARGAGEVREEMASARRGDRGEEEEHGKKRRRKREKKKKKKRREDKGEGPGTQKKRKRSCW